MGDDDGEFADALTHVNDTQTGVSDPALPNDIGTPTSALANGDVSEAQNPANDHESIELPHNVQSSKDNVPTHLESVPGEKVDRAHAPVVGRHMPSIATQASIARSDHDGTPVQSPVATTQSPSTSITPAPISIPTSPSHTHEPTSRQTSLPNTPVSTSRLPISRGESQTSSNPQHARLNAHSTPRSSASTRSAPIASVAFLVTALESIAASKDARRRRTLADATTEALTAIKAASDLAATDPSMTFQALKLATESSTPAVVNTALDCIAKLMNYSYFVTAQDIRSDAQQAPSLIELVIDAICDCASTELPAPDVQMNMIKALLAAILNDKVVVHGAGLLKSVRQTYSLFLHSRTPATQQVAQSVLMQMIGTSFERVKTRLAARAARAAAIKTAISPNGDALASEYVTAHDDGVTGTESPGDHLQSPTTPSEASQSQVSRQMTLQTFETRRSFDDNRIGENAPTIISPLRFRDGTNRTPSGQQSARDNHDPATPQDDEEEDEAYVKDAFLVFRAMCKLSEKPMAVDDSTDPKSQKLRSKLLTLNIIKTILDQHHLLFTSPYATIRSSTNNEPTSFTQAVKQYLCLSLSRNGASPIEQVFGVSADIFWLMLKNLRSLLKRELEVFLKEIYLAILDKRNAPPFQKQHISELFTKITEDAKLLVEMYLNYDCDRSAMDNVFQKTIEHISRQACAVVQVTPDQEHAYYEDLKAQAGNASASTRHSSVNAANTVAPEYTAKQQSLQCLVNSLRSMVSWSQQALRDPLANTNTSNMRRSYDSTQDAGDKSVIAIDTSKAIGDETGTQDFVPDDDPSELGRIKARKTALNEAVRQFNYKPKRGLKLLIEGDLLPSDSPAAIANFLLTNERVNKTMLGDYLGGPEPENTAVMHAFVDQLDFTKTRFVEALRRFLQSFRLPGEAQKIDRLMLKFAERYTNGNPQAFANADTAYVLSYSVIMLNTDQHSSNVKRRMTIEDFIKNNRGINDNDDLPDEYLKAIFDEIASNEIVLDTEREVAANLGMLPQTNGSLASNITQAITTVGRDLRREAYAQASEEMANKTEQMFKTLMRSQRRGQSKSVETRYVEAHSSKHVGPMFEATWTSYLTALSGHAQETTSLDAVTLCIEGQKLAIRLACLFDLEHPRRAFVNSLAQFTNLYNFSEMKTRNVEALKALVDIALLEGNLLKESWRNVLTSISQLDRFQLISTGAREGDIPDVLKAQSQARQQPSNRRRPRTDAVDPEIADAMRSSDMVRGVDRIFTNTATLSGEAIVEFVQALAQVSWQEIESSGASEQPRTYSLQKLVEVSSYNMTRVRFEWTTLWQILGQHFVDVGCHSNTNVVYFALNSLRQLSMKFLELDELPGFKFQKDFLKPFERILTSATQVPVKDMVLRCLIQMIQAKGQNIRSGWRTMFGVFTAAAREPHESIVTLAFDNVTQVYNERFGVVISQGAFADLIMCLTEFSKNQKFQKKSLQAIVLLRNSIDKMLRTPECPLSRNVTTPKDPSQATDLPKQPTVQTEEEQFWFPVFFAFHDVLMTGEDLEVRSRALDYLFETLRQYGGSFPQSFWDKLWNSLLYPIFEVLKSKSDMSRALNNEELSVWLSTTMIEALRRMIRLCTHFFETLEYMLQRFLKLLALCICQENDTLARIGSNCLQQLILNNVRKFEVHHWEQIVIVFEELFERTEATALFTAAANNSYRSSSFSSIDKNAMLASADANTLSAKSKARAPSPVSEHHLQLTESHNSRDTSENRSSQDAQRVKATRTPSQSVESPDALPTASSADSQPELESFNPEATHATTPPVVVTAARRRFFNQIITKCVLQLLMIETVSELFTNDTVYSEIPSHLLLRLMSLLKKSYKFARRFNDDRELRTRLFKEGFMRQPPNLLKQESGSASVYINILLRMYADDGEERIASRSETEAALVPLCADILSTYIDLDDETQQRNIVTWRPVVIDVVEGYTCFRDEDLDRHVEVFAPLAVGLMNRDMGLDMQRAVQGLWARICEVKFGVSAKTGTYRAPVSPVRSVFGSRRGSMVKR